MSDVLVLSPAGEPVGLVSWQRAMVLKCSERVEVVRTYEDRQIHGSSWVLDMPAVVRYFEGAFHLRWRKKVKFSRQNVYLRDHGQCQYCGDPVRRDAMTFEHVLPTSKGGRTTWENIVIACLECNQRKGSRTPGEAGMRLRRAPSRPAWLPGAIFAPALKHGVPAPWRDFLGHIRSELYWNDELEA